MSINTTESAKIIKKNKICTVIKSRSVR